MTPDKINTIIPEIHEMKKQRGEWEGLPTIANVMMGPNYVNETKQANNAYIASKLDEITIDAAKAMEAYREGRRAGISVYESIKNQPLRYNPYEKLILDSLEDLLASVAIRTMDLMGFYGVEYVPRDNEQVEAPANVFLSVTIGIIAHASVEQYAGEAHTHDNLLSGTIQTLLRIAELEQIDLEWHINARLAWLNK